MRRIWIVLGLSCVLLAMSALPAHAITYGTDDGTGHPNVGSIIVHSKRTGENVQFCSGSLISPTVFLTASHCTIFLDERGYTPSEVWVTFDPVLGPGMTLLTGHWVTNPAFNHRQSDSADVAVFILDEAKNDVTPAALPAEGLFDEMFRDRTLQSQIFTNVGYGTSQMTNGSAGPQEFPDTNRRMTSTSHFTALNKAWLRLSQNNAHGDGGTCYGDSGGPQFIGSSNTLASVTVTGDTACYSTNVTYRLDQAGARDFLKNYVTLP
jgi:secreted trypsin-like serine protease